MNINFNKSKICIIGGHISTEILINNLKKFYNKQLDIYYYKPKKIKNLVLYSNLKTNIKTKENFFQFTKLNEVENKIIKHKYDYLFAIGLSQIVSTKIIQSVKKKVIGFHPSFLPNGKGRSSSAWNLRLKKNGGCTFFIINDEKVDSGKIIYRKKIKINNNDSAETYTKKYLSLFDNMTKNILNRPEYFFYKKKKNSR
jgi:methionyl-tRNA formyltransferase